MQSAAAAQVVVSVAGRALGFHARPATLPPLHRRCNFSHFTEPHPRQRRGPRPNLWLKPNLLEILADQVAGRHLPPLHPRAHDGGAGRFLAGNSRACRSAMPKWPAACAAAAPKSRSQETANVHASKCRARRHCRRLKPCFTARPRNGAPGSRPELLAVCNRLPRSDHAVAGRKA